MTDDVVIKIMRNVELNMLDILDAVYANVSLREYLLDRADPTKEEVKKFIEIMNLDEEIVDPDEAYRKFGYDRTP